MKLKSTEYLLAGIALVLSVIATAYSYFKGYILAYGDAESHLNIAKRVVSGLTPGFAQLGGVWLPLPHLLMMPFVYFDGLWRTGLAGSIVSGVAFIVAALFIFKIVYRISQNRAAAIAAFFAFALNPNILYMQSTPMTELPLICFQLVSSYFFLKFLEADRELESLLLAALFGFLSALTRYDGWFLVAFEAAAILFRFMLRPKSRKQIEGQLVLFSTLAFFAIFLWLGWSKLILGDPLYFVHSQYSAGAQQQFFLAKGQLQGYHNISLSFLYYFFTSMRNVGSIMFALGFLGLAFYLFRKTSINKFLFALILGVPFVFYVATMFLGQSIIFLPGLTPQNFDWQLFNVRYGLMMVSFIAIFFGFLYAKGNRAVRIILIVLMVIQLGYFALGRTPVLTLADGISGLSHAKRPDAERWMAKNYDHGLVLLDDYARTISVIRSNIPMQDVIYVGTKPYWQESLERPEKYATWIVMQKNDDVWNNIYEQPQRQGELYKYFQKVYTSPEITIFKRNTLPVSS